MQHHLHYSA